MRQRHGDYEIDEDRSRIDVPRVHSWLTQTYWSPGISIDTVMRGIRGCSMAIGAYHADGQVGVTRIISDKATFAWVADVYVDEAHRNKGLARAMVKFALDHPDYRGLRRWVLATKDAHGVYAALGFGPLPEPQRWMIYKPGATG